MIYFIIANGNHDVWDGSSWSKNFSEAKQFDLGSLKMTVNQLTKKLPVRVLMICDELIQAHLDSLGMGLVSNSNADELQENEQLFKLFIQWEELAQTLYKE